MHVFALYMKRLHYGKRDKSSITCNTMIPILLLILSMQFLTSSITVESRDPIRLDYETAFDVPNTLVPVHAAAGTDAAKVSALSKIPRSEVWPELTSSDSGNIFGVDYTDGCPTTESTESTDGKNEQWRWDAGCAGTWFGARRALSGSAEMEQISDRYGREFVLYKSSRILQSPSRSNALTGGLGLYQSLLLDMLLAAAQLTEHRLPD